MRILFLTTHFNIGGITSYILTLSKELVSMGHRVYVVSSGGNMVEEFENLGGKHVTLNIRTKSVLSWKIYCALPMLARLLRREQIDIMHAHTRVTQWMAGWLQRLTGRPYVTTCHGFFRARGFRKIFPCWGKKVVAISPPVADHLANDFYVPEDRIVQVRNGIDLQKFFPAPPDLKTQKRLEYGCQRCHTLGIIARLSDVKGHRVLIDAMPRIIQDCGKVTLLIVGEGKEEDALREQVRRLGLHDAVCFYPVVNKTADFFSLFDCFVMPSLQEGLGLSVMEAQAAGLPVVASRVGGIIAVVEDGKTGLLFKPNDPDALAEAVIRVLKDLELAQRLGAQARAKAEREYGADRMAEKISTIYQGL